MLTDSQNSSHIISHFGDDLPSQSIDLCKTQSSQPISWLVLVKNNTKLQHK